MLGVSSSPLPVREMAARAAAAVEFSSADDATETSGSAYDYNDDGDDDPVGAMPRVPRDADGAKPRAPRPSTSAKLGIADDPDVRRAGAAASRALVVARRP
jgi:hypothetical protein